VKRKAMNKIVLILIGLVIVGALSISGFISKRPPDSSGVSFGTPRPSTFILRKDIKFSVEGPEYVGNPEEKFLLAGPDKDLTSKKSTMSKVGTIVIDGSEKEVWRCHVYDSFKGKPLVYLYVMKDPVKFIMDVYLAEAYWDKKPHDTDIIPGPELKPIEQVSFDLRVVLNNVEKLYTLIKEADGTPRKEKFEAISISSLRVTPVLKSINVKNIGNLDIYQLEGDTINITMYGIETGVNILDGKDHEFFVFGLITGPKTDKPISLKSLQLRTIPFVQISKGNWWLPDCKPAIYLYPQKNQFTNVKVIPKGEFTLTIPDYPKDGWSVLAEPDGTIQSNGRNYEYLYYEAKINDEEVENPEEGYISKFQELPNLYSKILPKLGLNSKETSDFKKYWEKSLPFSPYYFVGIMNLESINKIEPLIVNPRPDTVIRVRLYFKPIEKPIKVKEPPLIDFSREGFALVEWGGMVKMNKNHPFTCSQ
jgi:hypothetical protein